MITPNPDDETVTIGFSPDEASLVKYAIRKHAQAEGEPPVVRATRWIKQFDKQPMFAGFPDEIWDDPSSPEELLACFNENDNRATFSNKHESEVEICVLSMLLQMTRMGEQERLQQAKPIVESALDKLSSAADEYFWFLSPEEQEARDRELVERYEEAYPDMGGDKEEVLDQLKREREQQRKEREGESQ
ncbi:MAG TPA: hypothetical protein VLA12_23420 [Planctomycetaceae bacterium]|nr:hypothetical protein [Planctomycetaceae bacterium]